MTQAQKKSLNSLSKNLKSLKVYNTKKVVCTADEQRRMNEFSKWIKNVKVA